MPNLNLLDQIYFFNIGKYQANDTYFEWTNASHHKSSILDVRMTRNPPVKNIFYSVDIDSGWCKTLKKFSFYLTH